MSHNQLLLLGESKTIPNCVKSKIGLKLHNKKDHPIFIIKQLIYDFFKDFSKFDELSEFVNVTNNFDRLLIPKEHPSRSKSDTFYLDETTVLRTHTSAHQTELLELGYGEFLVTGDVYRKDEINGTHYPVFHQTEGVKLVEEHVDPETDLKETLAKLVEFLFPSQEYRFNKDYFPFTNPSFEIEVKFGDKWLEILGCGVIQPKILEDCGIKQKGWAFGLGLERLAMILFNIPDIRLFWSHDPRFLDQFTYKDVESSFKLKFIPYSKLDTISKDISFWINDMSTVVSTEKEGKINYEWTLLNQFYETIREICGNDIQEVDLYDKFYNKKTIKVSHTFKLSFSPSDYELNDPGKFNSNCNTYMEQLRESVQISFDITLR